MQYHHVRGLAGKWQNHYLYQVCTPLQSKRPVKHLLCLVMMWCLIFMHSCWQLLCSVLSVKGFSWIWRFLLLVVRLEDCSCLCRHLPRWRFWSAEAECFQGGNSCLGQVSSGNQLRNSWEPGALVPGQNTFLWWLQWDRSSEDRWRRLESVKSDWSGGGKGPFVIFGYFSKILHSRLSTHCQSLDMLLTRCGAF